MSMESTISIYYMTLCAWYPILQQPLSCQCSNSSMTVWWFQRVSISFDDPFVIRFPSPESHNIRINECSRLFITDVITKPLTCKLQ